jgi:serine/threonine protein kinase
MTVRTAQGTSIDDSGTHADDADVGVSGVSETPLAPIAEGSVAAWPPEDSPAILAKLGVGTIIEGKYRVDEVLGRGTMGVVVAATHLHLLESVALKFINVRVSSRGEDFRARFRREAQLSAKLRSEHIARVIDVGVWQGGTPFMVMEHLAGMDLRKVIKTRGPLPLDVALDYVVQVCEGLAEAHGLGVVHRDLKPSNIFITQRPDGTDLVKILDFGISKWSVEEDMNELTQSGVVLGSPKYMAAEHLFGSANVDARADVWSIGAIFYAMLVGRSPYDFTNIMHLCAELATENPPGSLCDVRPDVPPALDAVVMRCFERDRERRVQSVADLAGDLLDAVDAPFATSVRQSIGAALAPKRAREPLSSTGGHPMATGQYRALNLLGSTSTGAMVSSTPAHKAGGSTAPVSLGSDAETTPPPRARRRGLLLPAIAALALLGVVAVGARVRQQQALGAAEMRGPVTPSLIPAVTPGDPSQAIAPPEPTVLPVAVSVSGGPARPPAATSASAAIDARHEAPAPRTSPPHHVALAPSPAPGAPAPLTRRTAASAAPRVDAPDAARVQEPAPEPPRKKIDPLEERQ